MRQFVLVVLFILNTVLSIAQQQTISSKVTDYSWEAWKDWRRTGFPVLTPAVDAVDSRGIPLRLGYPANESTLNGSNYNEAVSRLGGKDDNYGKMWWLK